MSAKPASMPNVVSASRSLSAIAAPAPPSWMLSTQLPTNTLTTSRSTIHGSAASGMTFLKRRSAIRRVAADLANLLGVAQVVEAEHDSPLIHVEVAEEGMLVRQRAEREPAGVGERAAQRGAASFECGQPLLHRRPLAR